MRVGRIGQRVLSLLLAITLVFSLSAQALAYDTIYAKDESGTAYTSISAAWSAAKDGKVITMQADWNLGDRLTVGSGQSVTIDMNGYKIDRGLSDDETNGEVIYLDEGANLTLKSTQKKSFTFQGWSSGSRTDCTLSSGGLVTGGWSSNGAGGIHMKKSAALTLDNVSIAGNYTEVSWFTDGDGGGVKLDDTSCRLVMKNGAQIAYNAAEDEGGGVYVNGTDAVIEMSGNSSISNNSADEGGGIYFCKSCFTLRGDSTAQISNNQANSNGGGIYTEQCMISTNAGLIYEILLEKNTAGSAGGAIYLDQEQTSVSSCTIESNSAKEGGGIYVNNDDITLAHCTIQSNSATSEGGGVFVSSQNDIGLSGTLKIQNNTRSGNVKDDLFLNDTTSANAYITGVPTGKSSIGIRTADKTRKINNDHAFYYAQAFFSDFDGYHIEFDGETSQLKAVEGKAAEVPTFTAVDPEKKSYSSYNGETLIHGYFRYASVVDSSDLTSDYYYSDGYFLDGDESDGGDPDQYNSHLATMSMTMALAGFNSSIGGDGKLTGQTEYDLSYTYKSQNIEKLLTDIGVDPDDIYISDTYSVKPGTDTIGVAIGQKSIWQKDGYASEAGSYTLVPIVVRSAGYESEWASNVTIGESGEEKGFASAAKTVFLTVQKYIQAYGLTEKVASGKVKFWIMGYSRGGATANLTAKRLVEAYCDGTSDAMDNQVYAYCFEAPQGGRNDAMTLSEEHYYCIHNCINKADAVPEVAPDEMGFMRYGVDHYIPGEAEASDTPDTDQTVWSFVAEQSWASKYRTWYDNTAWSVGSTEYLAQRTKMLEQLESIDPVNFTFYDRFAIAEQNIFPMGTNELSYDGTPITQEQYIHILIRAVLSWGLYNSSTGDFRNGYHNIFSNGDGVTYPSFESALQIVVPIVFGKSSEELEGIMSAVMSGKNEMLSGFRMFTNGISIYDDVVGDWVKLSQSDRDGYLEKFWTYLMCTEDPLTHRTALSYLTSSEQTKLRSVWDVLMDVVLRFVSVDYKTNIPDWNSAKTPTGSNKTTPITENYTGNQKAYGKDSLVVLGTLLYNTTAIAQAHYPEINFAWLRSYDSLYDRSSEKNSPVEIKTDDVPSVTVSCKNNVMTLETDLEGASVYYRIKTEDGTSGSYSAWYPYNQEVVLATGTFQVQTTAVYCGNISQVQTTIVEATPEKTYQVYVFSQISGYEEIGSFKSGATVTVDGTKDGVIFKNWSSNDITLTESAGKNALLTFTMPEKDIVLHAAYTVRIGSVTLYVDAPEAGKALPATGTLSWYDTDNNKAEATVPVYWIEQVNGGTQTASGKARYGTKYAVAALAEQDLDQNLAFSMDLDTEDVSVVYGSDAAQQAYKAYTDDTGALRIFGGQIETEKATIQTVPTLSISLTEDSTLAQLQALLPAGVTVTLIDGTQTTLALDTEKAVTSDVIGEDGTVRAGNVTIPILGTESVDAENRQVSIAVAVEALAPTDMPTATAEPENGEAQSTGMTETFQTLSLKVRLACSTENAVIYYRINGGEMKVYNADTPVSLTGEKGEKTTYVLTTWTKAEGYGKSSEATYTYTLDNPFTVTIHGRDTGLLGIAQNQELWQTPKTYTYYKGENVTIAPPSEADEIFEKWESIPSSVSGTQKDLSLTIDAISSDITLTAVYNPVINGLRLTIDTPVTGEKLPTAIREASVTVTDTYSMTDYFKEIEWTPADTTAAGSTVYTAKVKLDLEKFQEEAAKNNVPEESAKELKYILSEKLDLDVNNGSADLKASVSNEDNAVSVTFQATEAASEKASALISVQPLSMVSLSYAEAEAGNWNLPENATLNLSDGSKAEGRITWNQPVFESKKLSYTVTGTVALPEGVTNPDQVSAEVSVEVLVAPSDPDTAPGKPYASLSAGTYRGMQYVRLFRLTSDAVIYYTLDGTEPTMQSTRYEDNTSIVISSSKTLKAIAVKGGKTSDVVSYTYEIQPGQVTLNLSGSTEAPLETKTLSYVVSAEDADQLATATLTFAVNGLENVKTEGLNGWKILAESRENGVLKVLVFKQEGVSGQTDRMVQLSGSTAGMAGEVSVKLTAAKLAVYVDEGEDYITAVFGNAEVVTKIQFSTFDVNRDGAVDMLDITRAQRCFGLSEGSQGWNPLADVDGNGKVDIQDLILILNNYTKAE